MKYFVYRTWQPRDIISTKDSLHFARGIVVMDSVPLHEIISVNVTSSHADEENPQFVRISSATLFSGVEQQPEKSGAAERINDDFSQFNACSE